MFSYEINEEHKVDVDNEKHKENEDNEVDVDNEKHKENEEDLEGEKN